MRIKYTKEQISDIVKRSITWAQVCRELGIKPATGSQSNLTNKAKKWGIDYSHFVGQSFNRGRIFLQHRKEIKFYLKLNGPFINSHALKKKLIQSGLKKNLCEVCKLNKWFGEDLPLELDHINGNTNDNRIENLKILCPNCHAVKTRKDRKNKRH